MTDAQTTEPTTRYVQHVMGMPISLAMRGQHADDATGARAWDEVMDSLGDADRTFSTYRADSWISRLGRGEVAVADCPTEVREVLELGDRAEQRSGGAFSVERTSPDGETGLDTDGIVKGWAVQRASAILRRLPGTDFCLSAGGDLICHTSSPTGRPWRVGIENPLDATRILATVSVRRGAVATSGLAHRGAHIVDARTGRTPTDVASVSVVSDLLTWADIDATSAFAMGREAARWLSERPGRTGLVVWLDGTTTPVGGHMGAASFVR